MCSFFYPKQDLLKPFFDYLHQLRSRSRQSYFIRAHLCSNFGVPVTLAGAINRTRVVVKFVWDRKMSTFRYGKDDFKNIVSRYPDFCNTFLKRTFLGSEEFIRIRFSYNMANCISNFFAFLWIQFAVLSLEQI